MTDHYAHYIKRQIIPYDPNRWEWLKDARPGRQPKWFDLVQKKYGDFDRPSKHVTRSNDQVVTGVKPNDFIWLFSQISYRNKLVLPPSLDAIIQVEGQPKSSIGPGKTAAERTEFTAGDLSEWHLLSDWSSALKETRVRLISGLTPKIPELGAHVGNALQSFRQIHDIAPLMEKLELERARPGYHFVSYRHSDGIGPAIDQVKKLVVDQRQSVWFDRWCLPRRLAEGREALSEQRLEDHIKGKIRGAETVWGIETTGYKDANAFTRNEQCWAGKKYKRVP